MARNSTPTSPALSAQERLAEYRKLAREIRARDAAPAAPNNGLTLAERIAIAAAGVPAFFEDVSAVYTAARASRR